jgi:3-hydroxyisobutyrate dehydrogenase-like beta-hydroxyacid dehydrogenase
MAQEVLGFIGLGAMGRGEAEWHVNAHALASECIRKTGGQATRPGQSTHQAGYDALMLQLSHCHSRIHPVHAGMAANLQRFLKSDKSPMGTVSDTLLLYNRTASKADALAKDLGSQVAQSVEDMGQQCSIISMMLADDTACDLILRQLLSTGGACLQGKVVINHSTNTPEFSTSAQEQVAAAGGVYLAVPVWGR